MKSYDEYKYFYDREGNRVRKHIRASSLAELNRKIEKIQQELNSAPVLEKVIDEWQSTHEEDINLNTQNCYIAPINQLKEYFKDESISDVTPLQIDQFLHYLLEDYQYARQTIKLRLIVLNQVCDYAVIKGYINNNPCSSVKVPNKAVSHKRQLPLSADIEKVKNSVNSAPFGLFAYLILYTGCRRGEALALTWNDVDFKSKIITINKTVIFDGNIATIQNHPKTDKGDRIIPLLAPLEEQLQKIKKKSGIIFPNEKNEYLTKSQLNIKLRQYKRESGVNATPHQLRHQYATILYEAGIEVKDAQELLGHNSASVTQDIYQHISEVQKKKSFDKLNEYINQPCTKNVTTILETVEK